MNDKAAKIDLNDLCMIRCYRRDVGPYASITDLPPDEAVALCEQLLPHRGETAPDTDGHRDQATYMQRRIQVEQWLRDGAAENGVRMDRRNPVYFSVERDPQKFIDQFASDPDMGMLVLKLRDLDLSNWSFTMDDSFVSRGGAEDRENRAFGYPSHPLHGKVLNAAQLAAAFEQSGYPEPLQDGTPRYFEAQMWADKPSRARKDFTIRAVEPQDREALLDLVRTCYFGNDLADGREKIAQSRVRELISPPPGSRAFIAVADGKPTAFTYVTPDTKRPGILVDDLHTLQAYQGYGIASALLQTCEQFAKERGTDTIHLNVIAADTHVVDFYSRRNWLKQSFENAGIKTDIDPEIPAVRTHLMQKDLSGPA